MTRLVFYHHLGPITKKNVSDQVRHIAGCTATEVGARWFWEAEGLFYLYSVISCAFTAQLVCVFVFAYAKGRFSHDMAHL